MIELSRPNAAQAKRKLRQLTEGSIALMQYQRALNQVAAALAIAEIAHDAPTLHESLADVTEMLFINLKTLFDIQRHFGSEEPCVDYTGQLVYTETVRISHAVGGAPVEALCAQISQLRAKLRAHIERNENLSRALHAEMRLQRSLSEEN